MLLKKLSFPCKEPERCLISSETYDVRISCRSDGKISSTKHRKRSEEWIIVPCRNDNRHGMVMLQSVKHYRYLSSMADGQVFTTAVQEDADTWQITVHPTKRASVFLTSNFHKAKLVFDNNENRFRTTSIASNDGTYNCDDKSWSAEELCWNIEYLSGELCFISSQLFNKQIQCNFFGNPTMSRYCGSGEVWRFVEAGDGMVYICPWIESNLFLSSTRDGQVLTTCDRGCQEVWVVEKASDESGTVIKSVSTGQYLCISEDGIGLETTPYQDLKGGIWELETANKNMFNISSIPHDQRISCSKGSSLRKGTSYMTNKRSRWEDWIVEDLRDGSIRLYSKVGGVYLGCDSHGNIVTNPKATDGEAWCIEESPNGGFSFVSDMHHLYLACKENGDLYTTKDKLMSDDISWRLEPRMPSTMNGFHIGALFVAGSASIAAAAFMPFVVAGKTAMVGALSVGNYACAGAIDEMINPGSGRSGVLEDGSFHKCPVGAEGMVTTESFRDRIPSVKSKSPMTGTDVFDSREYFYRSVQIEVNRPFCAWKSW